MMPNELDEYEDADFEDEEYDEDEEEPEVALEGRPMDVDLIAKLATEMACAQPPDT
jgi:hypothetical protein